MALSYKRLWKLLIDKDLNRQFLREHFHPATIAKLGKNEPVAMTVLMKLCDLLQCNLDDIVEYYPESEQEAAARELRESISRPEDPCADMESRIQKREKADK